VGFLFFASGYPCRRQTNSFDNDAKAPLDTRSGAFLSSALARILALCRLPEEELIGMIE
jgi:hypothetical protein